jgi:hypothetical protein
VFLASCDTLPLAPPEVKMAGLLGALKAGDVEAVHAWMASDEWQTVETLLVAVGGDSGMNSPTLPRAAAAAPRRDPTPPPALVRN